MSTNCVFPPELDDKQLLLYLDGEADDETASHLKRCTYCRGKAETLGRLQKRLTTRLYRLTCPPPIELGEYHLRMLPASQMLVVGQHVRECSYCAHEIAQLEEFMSESEPQVGLLGPIKVLIAQLAGGREVNNSSLTPALAGLRGQEEEPFIYQADHVQIVIEVQDDVEQMGLKVLLGLVTGLESNAFIIQVSRDGQIITTSPIDEIGNFVISHLVPGQYELKFTSSNLEIQIPYLSV